MTFSSVIEHIEKVDRYLKNLHHPLKNWYLDDNTGISENKIWHIKSFEYEFNFFLLNVRRYQNVLFDISAIGKSYIRKKKLIIKSKVDSDRKWIWQKYLQNFLNEKFKKQFHLFTCILPDYLGHESSQESLKNNHFENTRDDFLRRCLNSLRQTSPESIFRNEKNNN